MIQIHHSKGELPISFFLFYRGPELLKFIPGKKANDLKVWLQAYRYWNQGGSKNAASMLQLLQSYYTSSIDDAGLPDLDYLPELEVTPDIGLLHPLLTQDDGEKRYFTSPKDYITWRESKECTSAAIRKNFSLAPNDAPRVAILLYRKHVITNQRYIGDLITIMEAQAVFPVSIRGSDFQMYVLQSNQALNSITNRSLFLSME